MTNTLYDRIGNDYDITRTADQEILERLKAYLNFPPEGLYLDVACGSGNYTIAMAEQGYHLYGVDVSEKMLNLAKRKSPPSVQWFLHDATAMPFADGSFSGAVCVCAIHHFSDLVAVFQEIFRVLRKGKFVIFSGTADQMHHYWLNHYFPEAMAKSIQQMPSVASITSALERAGFSKVVLEPFFVTDALKDMFLYSGKQRPHLYLDPNVRAGISTFASLATDAEIHDGCRRLSDDLESGAIKRVIEKYDNAGGDYMFIVAEKA
ncbi:MAG: class I SAM-dependent methyltransferase [Anaerolineae bacterium]|nr:class I SAM-dependent methyltransferase [Gloeobacterales cyanobacterium ES-bin-313]